MNGYTIANNFNHSILKNRIFMMEKETSTGRSLLRALYLLPLVCICLAVNAKTKINYVYDNNGNGQNQGAVTWQVSLDNDTLKATDTAHNALTSVEGLIDQLPGVQKDENGNITVNGRTISKVLFDGKIVYENQEAQISEHTVHMNYSGTDQDYITYSDTITQRIEPEK
jgi:archaellum component FlaF (FlaF/FlaG flagellin family)